MRRTPRAALFQTPHWRRHFSCFTLLCVVALFVCAHVCSAALSPTEVVSVDDILLVRYDNTSYTFDSSSNGWLQTLCLMNGAYPLAVYNVETRDSLKAALIRGGKTSALLGGYSCLNAPSGSGYLTAMYAGTNTFNWVDEDNMIPRYAAGMGFFGRGINSPYVSWTAVPTDAQHYAFMTVRDANMVGGDLSSGDGVVACRRVDTPTLNETLSSSIVFYEMVKFNELADFPPSARAQCAAQGMRLMQPSTAPREFALEAAVLRQPQRAGDFVFLGGGFLTGIPSWRWNDAREEPRGAAFSAARYQTETSFAELTYANWRMYYPQASASQSLADNLVLAAAGAWQNMGVFSPNARYSVACEPLLQPFTEKGLYAVEIPSSSSSSSSLSPTVAKSLCMLANKSGEAATVMNQTENDELLRVMIRTGIPLAEQRSGSAMPVVPALWFLLGAFRPSAELSWDSFSTAPVSILYVPTTIQNPSRGLPALLAAPTQLPWRTSDGAEATHVACQPSSVVAANGTITIARYDASSRAAAGALEVSSTNTTVSPLEAAACAGDSAPMIVDSPEKQKALEAALARGYFRTAAPATVPSDDTFVYLNAVRRGGAWVWGDGTPVSFAMWDASAADPAGSEGDRLAVQLRERGWHAAAAPTTGTAYVACYSDTPDPGDTGGGAGGNGSGDSGNDGGGSSGSGSSGWPWWAYLIIGVGAGVIVLLIILIVVLCCCGCCCACCPCGARKEKEKYSEASADKFCAAPTSSDAAQSLLPPPKQSREQSEPKHASPDDASVLPKPSRAGSDLTAADTHSRPHASPAAPGKAAAAPPAAANPLASPSPQPPAPNNSPQTVDGANSAQLPPPFQLYSRPNSYSFYGAPQTAGSFYGPGTSTSPQPPAPPNNSPQPDDEEEAAGAGEFPPNSIEAQTANLSRRRLSRGGSVKFVPPSQNLYAQTNEEKQPSRVASAHAKFGDDDDFFTDL